MNAAMPCGSKYPLRAFPSILAMSGKILLVEGRRDKIAFEILLKILCGRHDIAVHSVGDLLEFDEEVLGEREKVKKAYYSVIDTPHIEKLVGFIDREFDDFEWNGGFVDTRRAHKVSGRLVCSRGHSIENYCFDFG